VCDEGARVRICVYCGSRRGDDPRFVQAAVDVGQHLARGGHELVYGGGRVGLMGALADAALAAGARVTGVIPRALLDREVGHTGLTELIVVQTMHQRKLAMAERADAFVALPGGIGTLEELYEMWSWRQLGYHDKPVALLNVAGYYDPLLAFMRAGVAAGFVAERHHALLLVEDDVASLIARLDRAAGLAPGGERYTLL
jgi:uncharacterized protein (TIGR00730 family)